jgi:putative glycosyltransferase (TIGR04348 family)
MTEPMRIIIQTPAPLNSRSGNRVTAERWQAILADLGHHVDITSSYAGTPADLMIAIHAWRSAQAVTLFREYNPGAPIVVCLSGTDIYAYQTSHPEPTLATMAAATVLVGLHDLVGKAIPQTFVAKLHTIYQSVPPIPRKTPADGVFDICVIGHLRMEKNPFETALAARQLPPTSRLQITHVGRAMDESWANQATAEMAQNPRYHWLGDVPRVQVFALLATTRLMVLSSIMEGGANVIGEALAAAVPVISSDIDGSIGLLGADYPGLYPVGNPSALTALLLRAESDPKFLAQLTAHCTARAALFSPQRERASWQQLIADLASAHPQP